MALIETKELTKRYNNLLAVKDLSLSIEERDIFGFIGPNGAGKTTTIRILATLLEPTSGTAYIDGVNVVTHPYEVKKIVGFMPDAFGVYDGMRLREYLDFFGAAYKIPLKRRRAIIDDVLELTDLATKADDFVSSFSRGMKQRCCLAKTLIHDPKVLLLDEPASGLDPRARIEFRELVKALRDMGKTILISSHILTEMGDMCNRIGIIERGKLVSAGDFREILKQLRQTREIRLLVVEGADAAARVLEESPGIEHIDRSGNEFEFQTNLGHTDLAGLHEKLFKAGVRILFFQEEEGTLEDVFLQVTKGGI